MRFIKTMVCALVMMCACVSAQAQENAIGVNFGYMTGSNGVNNVGIGIKYDRFLSDALRAELNGMYYFPGSNKTDWFDANINFHYLFNVAEKINIYPIFGFTTMFGHTGFDWKDVAAGNVDFDKIPLVDDNAEIKKDGSYSDNHFRFGCNLGFGGQYNITEDFGLTLEAKYKLIKDFGNFNIALGCVVLF